MISSFLHKGLAELWETGTSPRIGKQFHRRVVLRLDALDAAAAPSDLDLPGFDFHALHGFSPTRYSMHVNGPWCITFEFTGVDAGRVDFKQYH